MFDARYEISSNISRTRGAAADYMAALALRLSCGDDGRVIGPAGWRACFATGRALERSWCVWVLGLARPMGQAH